MRYLLIPLENTALNPPTVTPVTSAPERDEQRDALARTFERTLRTCNLVVTYAGGIAGTPSEQ